MGRLFYSTLKQLKMTAKTMGAKHVGDVFIGLAAGQPHTRLPEREKLRIERATQKLMK
jgi:hypothetical protein